MVDKVIVIGGMPRSGTSWLGELLDSSQDVVYLFQPLFSYAFKDMVNYNSSPDQFQSLFEKMLHSPGDDFLRQKEKREKGLLPTFSKQEHPPYLVFKTCRYQYLIPQMLRFCPQVKLLGIIRHPCGAINSWLRNPKEFPPEADAMKEWRFGDVKNKGREEEFFGYYKWKEVANLYLDLEEKYPTRVMVIHYDRMVEDTRVFAERIFEFIDLRLTEQTFKFVDNCHALHSDDPYSVFKSKAVAHSWKEQLHSRIKKDILYDLQGTRLERFLT
jgi:hypothetical protein